MALAEYEASLSPCGQPVELAWHADSDGWWERTSYKCFACSEGADEPVYHEIVASTLPPDRVLMPFELGVTTETKQT